MPRSVQTRNDSRSRKRRLLEWLVRLRGSPHAIALGVATGTVVAFTPTIGAQIVIALGLATLLGANRPVAVVPTWLTNPLTMAPIYGFTYKLGSRFWPGPAPGSVSRAIQEATTESEALGFLALRAQAAVFLDLGLDVFVALWIGGLIVGLVAAAILYPVTLQTVIRLRASRQRRRDRRRSRRARRRRRKAT